jgi:hypothetical protein
MRKTSALLISILCLSLTVCASVSVDMPPNVGYLEDFDVTITIDDKDIQEKANVLTYVDYCGSISWTKGEILKDSFFDAPVFNYKGEARIDLSAVYNSPNREMKDCGPVLLYEG